LVKAFLPIETEVEKLKAQIEAQARDHREEMNAYAKQYEANIIQVLRERGLSLTSLVSDREAPKPDRPDLGRELRELRESLKLTQTEAGAIVKPDALDKSVVSRIEATGDAHKAYAVYSSFLRAEKIKRDRAAKAKADAEAAKRDPYRLPDISGEEVAAMAIQEAGGLAS
jgi:hypothetical protein